MESRTFDKILEDRLKKTKAVLASKAGEYATSDRLHNFKRAAGLTGRTPAQACVGMMVKHLVSVVDMTEKQAAGQEISQSLMDEKIGDAINYLVLLEAILRESE